MATEHSGTYLAPADDLPTLGAPGLDDEGMKELAGALDDPERAPKLLTKAEELLTGLKARVANIEAAASEAAERFEAEAKSFFPGENVRLSARGEMAGALRRKVAEKIRAFRGELEKNSDGDRTEVLRQLHALDRTAAALLPLYDSPSIVLSRAGLDSVARERYRAQLASAGPAELQAFARLAIAKKDRILGAAVAARVGELRKEQRPFAAPDLAERLVGDEQKRVVRALSAIRHRFQDALIANRAFVKGNSRPMDKINQGLRARRAEESK